MMKRSLGIAPVCSIALCAACLKGTNGRASGMMRFRLAYGTIERLVIEAAQQEGEKPSFENLPDTGMVMRTRTDANTGTKFNEFYGKRSFIADMWRPGRKVERIVDRRTGNAIWGRPLPAAR
jgi:hypothetical protein